jgi:hypothetical protein
MLAEAVFEVGGYACVKFFVLLNYVELPHITVLNAGLPSSLCSSG